MSQVQQFEDIMNCDQHRQKMRQFLDDYNKCVAENIKLKENNTRLKQQKNILNEKLLIALEKKLPIKQAVEELPQKEQTPEIPAPLISKKETLFQRKLKTKLSR